ncbi:TauD/TfdA family dioxygenase [Pedobacter steynii]|uniref:TauD/TfdA-like domain-containing protein n=1 Tax=Pedobacter steynii TaxID=430522 RepID=A0A1D7QNC6_9SPHI|nr:TauD/TfdA family dioxygenase [Pedobacter steynii]AOM80157.1 hypothetical protein BFS30_25150 [Pedobacter steynii]
MKNDLISKTELPVEVKLGDLTIPDFIDHFKRNKEKYDQQLDHVGALKFTGVSIACQDDFQQVVNEISTKFMNYIDGNSPRTKLSGNVYTSTEYDPAQIITMHNELSYSAKWPGKLFFSCIVPAASGGETLLASSSEIYDQMNKSIVEEIEKRGITYIRNLHSGEGLGPSWQDTFESDQKSRVEEYLRSYQINYEWGHNDSLKLKQFSKGILHHEPTGKKIWFNQIDQFHPIQLGDEMYETLEILYESKENFPMYVSFADGTEIPDDLVLEVLHTIKGCTIAPPWHKNELLIVNNELVSHGRNSFTGSRKVLVAMSE